MSRQIYRVRVVPEGPGLQIRGLQEFIDPADVPRAYDRDPVKRHGWLATQGMTAFSAALAEAHEAERDIANEHPLPPGLSHGDVESIVIFVELVPEG